MICIYLFLRFLVYLVEIIDTIHDTPRSIKKIKMGELARSRISTVLISMHASLL